MTITPTIGPTDDREGVGRNRERVRLAARTEGTKKRQSRRTLRSIGSSAEEHMSVRPDESSDVGAEKCARCELPRPRK